MASWPSPTRPSIARRTTGAIWCGNERAPLSQVRGGLPRDRTFLPARWEHAGRGSVESIPPSLPPPTSRPAAAAASPGGGTGVRTPPHPRRGPGPDRASTLTGQILDTGYQVLKKLGEGGMSYVYLAREVATGLEVAIKVLAPKLATDRSSVERLRREAGLAMRLAHPHVCRILRLGRSEGRV